MDKNTYTPLSYIEISSANLISNFQVVRNFLGVDAKICAVIKANAYGHGQNEVAKILEPYADYFQIDDVQELMLLRQVTDKPVLVLGYVAKHEVEEVLKLGGIMAVYDIDRLKYISGLALQMKIEPHVHIKIDAQLGRQGILLEELPQFLTEAQKISNVHIDAMYSHFSNIEDTEDSRHALKQIDIFQKAIALFKEHGFENIQTHISATSGILAYEKNMLCNPIVRLGIGLYGMWPSAPLQKQFAGDVKLKPVMRWVSHIAQVKTLPAGYAVGYGVTYVTDKPTKIAVIPQGYSDGFDRGFTNCGEVLIGGHKCPVIGRVAMNMFVVDVSGVAEVKAEDEVVLLGRQGSEEITAEEMAEKLDTINYEITTRVSPLLVRVTVQL